MPEIGQLKKLEYIHLGNNKLLGLPMELISCSSFKILVLWSNEFEFIPEWLSQLDLCELNFYSNTIKHLPENYKFLNRIKKLTLDEHLEKELKYIRKWNIF